VVIATGAGAFRGTSSIECGPSDQDAKGSDEDAGGRADTVSEEEDGMEPDFEVRWMYPNEWYHGLTKPKGVGLTPGLSSQGGSHRAADMPRNSGRRPDRRRRRSGADALYALSDAVHSMSVPHSSTVGPSALPPTSPECLTQAIRLAEVEEADLGADLLLRAVDLFEQDSRAPIAYLAFGKRGLRSTWLHRRLDRAAHESGLGSGTLFPQEDM